MGINEMNDITEIEKKLLNYRYDQIPASFIRSINIGFEGFSYLKSLLELKKQES